jgi:hypothetical protein
MYFHIIKLRRNYIHGNHLQQSKKRHTSRQIRMGSDITTGKEEDEEERTTSQPASQPAALMFRIAHNLHTHSSAQHPREDSQLFLPFAKKTQKKKITASPVALDEQSHPQYVPNQRSHS